MNGLIKSVVLGLGLAAGTFFGVSAASAQPMYLPFAKVENACPACQQGRFDKVELVDGRSVEAWVLAETPQYVLLRLHGELRLVGRPELAAITRSSATNRPTGQYPDVIVLGTGHVVAGKITEEHPLTGQIVLKSGDGKRTYQAHRSAIRQIYKGGQAYQLPEVAGS